MHTQVKETTDILDFTSFIKQYFPVFKFDGHNTKVVRQLGLWANRDTRFNDPEFGWHIDRGILISGKVGVGKDEMFRLLKKYLTYLRSPYVFNSKVVWEFAKPFQKDGYECFMEQTGNIYYEELAMTDELTGQATREFVNHFGTKILIGSEIINIRYKVFKDTAWQTHFSTNLNEDELKAIYGERCISRLAEMCNFISLNGVDHRGKVVPEFKGNKNQPPVPPAPKELDPEIEMENKRILEGGYQLFSETGDMPPDASLIYNVLIAYGVSVCTEDELRAYMENVAPNFALPVTSHRQTEGEKEKEKKRFIWRSAREIAVKDFYTKLKAAGATSIFGIRDVNVDQTIKPVVAELKNENKGTA